MSTSRKQAQLLVGGLIGIGTLLGIAAGLSSQKTETFTPAPREQDSASQPVASPSAPQVPSVPLKKSPSPHRQP